MASALKFYGTDFDANKLATHLEIFGQNLSSENDDVTLSSVLAFFRKASPVVLDLISQVCVLVWLLLVMPATNASSEHVFSGVRRIKTYLRSTVS